MDPSNRFANAGRNPSRTVGMPQLPWGGRAPDWSTDPVYQKWADRGVSPSVARYLAQRAAREREMMQEMMAMGGPGAVTTSSPAALYRRQLQDQQAQQEQQRNTRRNGVEMVASAGAEMAAASAGLVDPTSAALMVGARLAINIIDPSGALGL